MFIYKYNENVISAKKEIQFEKSYLKSLPNQNQQLGNNPLMLITHTVMIKKYVVQKNRIILKKKKKLEQAEKIEQYRKGLDEQIETKKKMMIDENNISDINKEFDLIN